MIGVASILSSSNFLHAKLYCGNRAKPSMVARCCKLFTGNDRRRANCLEGYNAFAICNAYALLGSASALLFSYKYGPQNQNPEACRRWNVGRRACTDVQPAGGVLSDHPGKSG